MNRLRVRIGDGVKDRVISPPDDNLMLWIEDEIDTILDVEFHFGPYRMDYLGDYAWDIFIDDRKVGRAKAWDEKPSDKKDAGPTFWPIVQIAFFAYLALC